MATGFKTATVNASNVGSTLTNYPTYVDLARLGITTLAEAQSIRVYADSAKTTQWAREIVTLTEMHVKIPSLTSTTAIYIEWDGVSADYAVTDTYGRNNVWSDYDLVMHMAGSNADSTGKNTPTNVGTMTFAGTGKIGTAGTWADVTGGYISVPHHARFQYTGDMYMSCWGQTSGTSRDSFFSKGRPWDSTTGYWVVNDDVVPSNISCNRPATSFSNLTVGTNFDIKTALAFFCFKKTAATSIRIYKNGALFQNNTTNATAAYTTNTDALFIGRRTDSADLWNGVFDEVRFRTTLPSDDWIATEYANQNAESTFWGTWTTVASAVARASNLLTMGV